MFVNTFPLTAKPASPCSTPTRPIFFTSKNASSTRNSSPIPAAPTSSWSTMTPLSAAEATTSHQTQPSRA